MAKEVAEQPPVPQTPVEYDPSLENFKDWPSVAKSYKELYGKLSSSTRVPGEGASDEEWQKYRKAVGVPDKEDGYKKAGSDEAERFLSRARADALKHGVTAKAWDSIVAAMDAVSGERAEEAKKFFAAADVEDPKERALVQRGLEHLTKTDPALRSAIETLGFHRAKGVTAILQQAARKLGNDMVPEPAAVGGNELGSVHRIADRIKEIYLDPKTSGRNGLMPEGKKLLAEAGRLTAELIDKGYQGATDPRLSGR